LTPFWNFTQTFSKKFDQNGKLRNGVINRRNASLFKKGLSENGATFVVEKYF